MKHRISVHSTYIVATQNKHLLTMDVSTNTSVNNADKIVISELLCYIQNKMTTTSHDIVIKSVTEFYRKEEINAAKEVQI